MILRIRSIVAPRQRSITTTGARLGKVPKELQSVRSLDSEDDHRHARAWLSGFRLSDVPKDALEVSYARSSGPGGQHVNKTNSKAVVRCDIHQAKGVWLPPFVIPALQKTVSVGDAESSRLRLMLAVTLSQACESIQRNGHPCPSPGGGSQSVRSVNNRRTVVPPSCRQTGADSSQQYYHAPDLLFQSQESRSAPQNLDRALSNLHATIVSAAKGLVRGETSDAQRERVRRLADADKARRKEMKMKQKAKKESRRKDW